MRERRRKMLVNKDGVGIQERGFAGHPIIGKECEFHRNTLITYKDLSWVISTIGLLRDVGGKYRLLGMGIAFKTEGWIAKEDNGMMVANYSRPIEITIEADWILKNFEDECRADAMHDKHVNKMVEEIVKVQERQSYGKG